MNWEKVDIIDYENFLCLGLNENGFHTRFFFLEVAKEQCNKGCSYSGWQGLYYLVLCTKGSFEIHYGSFLLFCLN